MSSVRLYDLSSSVSLLLWPVGLSILASVSLVRPSWPRLSWARGSLLRPVHHSWARAYRLRSFRLSWASSSLLRLVRHSRLSHQRGVSIWMGVSASCGVATCQLPPAETARCGCVDEYGGHSRRRTPPPPTTAIWLVAAAVLPPPRASRAIS